MVEADSSLPDNACVHTHVLECSRRWKVFSKGNPQEEVLCKMAPCEGRGLFRNPRGEQLESRNQIVFECSVAQTLFKDVLSASLNPRRYAFLSGVDLHYP